MKIVFYFILVIAFLLVYQRNPIVALIIIGMVIGLFVLKKSRQKRGKEGSPFSFFSRNKTRKEEQGGELMNILLYQKLLESFTSNPQESIERDSSNDREAKRKEELERMKQEILDLLDGE